MEHRRRKLGHPGQRAGRARLASGLELRRRSDHLLVAAQWVVLGHRQADEQRGDLIAEVAVASLAADVHRHHCAKAVARRILAASQQQLAQRTGGRTQNDIVDGAAERRTDRSQLLELDVRGRDPSCRADRHVQARSRRRDQLVTYQQIDHVARTLHTLPRMHHRVRARASGREARAGQEAYRRG